jgi:hypothetical protein
MYGCKLRNFKLWWNVHALNDIMSIGKLISEARSATPAKNFSSVK